MSRRNSKGTRLWLQPEQRYADGHTRAATWVIIDGSRKKRTGCGEADRAGADAALERYLAEKRTAERPRNRGADQVMIGDVLAIYIKDVMPGTARPRETGARIVRLIDWWGDRPLSDVTGQTCRAYAAERGSRAAARRELEDLRSAIRYHRQEGLCRDVVEVTLPEKSAAREIWLTRPDAAALLMTAWRRLEVQRGTRTRRHIWQHVARFVLVALYTGTRAGAVCQASFERQDGRGWIDLERGVFYRRPDGAAETKKRRPPVPLPDRLLAHLRRWHRLGAASPVEYQGKPVHDVDKAFRRAAAEAGLDGVTPHTLRHTAATWLMQAGVDLWEAAGYLGMTVETLESTYGHHHPDHLRGAADAIGGRGKSVGKNGGTKTDSAVSRLHGSRRKLRSA